ncbi:MAG: hypothetical protein V4643_15095 [Bacteroidota bacterium]
MNKGVDNGSSDDGTSDNDGISNKRFKKVGKEKGSSAEKMPDDIAKKLGIKDTKNLKTIYIK